MQTPRLTTHARQRCEEMGVVTKRVKRIVREPHSNRCTRDERWIAVRDDDPEISAVYVLGPKYPIVVTVLYRFKEYSR